MWTESLGFLGTDGALRSSVTVCWDCSAERAPHAVLTRRSQRQQEAVCAQTLKGAFLSTAVKVINFLRA